MQLEIHVSCVGVTVNCPLPVEAYHGVVTHEDGYNGDSGGVIQNFVRQSTLNIQ